MKNEADDYFRVFRILQSPEHFSDFKLTQVSFTASNPKYPKQAIMKTYPEATASAMREVGMLIELAEEPCHIVKYLHHILSKNQLFIFLEYCPKTLAKEIAGRKRNRQSWSSPEILLYLQDMLQTLKLLHFKRIVHRNINPTTIFLQDFGNTSARKMKLAHFQDSKQIHVGLTMKMSSMHGFETFLSPQHFQAVRNGHEVTYESTYKDDIWSLGRTFYDMMTLKNNEDMTSLYDEGERGFSTCLERELKSLHYSRDLISIMLSMLALDHESRPDASRLADQVQNALNGFSTCWLCQEFEGTSRKLMNLCQHTYCEGCIERMVEKVMQQNGTLDSLRCIECERTICARIESEVTNVQLRAKLDMLRLNNYVRCANDQCEKKHSQLQLLSGRAKAYLVACDCGAKYCSYCHRSGGHGLFGVFSKCPRVLLA